MTDFVFSEPVTWIIIAVIFAIIEAFTLGLSTIWFSVGGVAACIAALLGAPIFLQVVVFLAVSIIALYVTRPLAEKKLKIGHEKNIIESIIGSVAIVTKEITPFATGQVKRNGQIWTAITEEQKETIAKGMTVVVKRIEGVKLIVEPVAEEAESQILQEKQEVPEEKEGD